MNKKVIGLAVVAVAAAWLTLRSVRTLNTPTVRPADAEHLSDGEVEGMAMRVGSASATSNPTPPRLVTAESRQAADRIRATIAAQFAEAMRHGPDFNSVNGDSGAQSAMTEDVARARAIPTMPAPVGSSNQANEALGRYVQDRITKDFFPMGASCYQELLTKLPGARGKIVFDVTIVGNTSVGGVVDAVEVNEESTLKDEKLVVCMRESMFGMPFDAPPAEQEKVTFTLPIELSPDPPADAAAASPPR
jgi:hypothetical protein